MWKLKKQTQNSWLYEIIKYVYLCGGRINIAKSSKPEDW